MTFSSPNPSGPSLPEGSVPQVPADEPTKPPEPGPVELLGDAS